MLSFGFPGAWIFLSEIMFGGFPPSGLLCGAGLSELCQVSIAVMLLQWNGSSCHDSSELWIHSCWDACFYTLMSVPSSIRIERIYYVSLPMESIWMMSFLLRLSLSLLISRSKSADNFLSLYHSITWSRSSNASLKCHPSVKGVLHEKPPYLYFPSFYLFTNA